MKPEPKDVCSPFALAKRATLADPEAAEIALEAARAAASDADEAFSPEDAARAVAASLRIGAGNRASTALGRYFLWSQHRGAQYRLTESDYQGAMAYANLHGAVWAGLRDDLATAEENIEALPIAGIVTQRRHPPAAIGHFVASETADLTAKPILGREEKLEHRGRLWRRYLDAHTALTDAGRTLSLVVEDLIIEDHDPWFVDAGFEERLYEEKARARAAEVFRHRKLLSDGLGLLARFFGFETTPTKRPERAAPVRRRLDIMFHPHDAAIDRDRLAAATARLKRQETTHG